MPDLLRHLALTAILLPAAIYAGNPAFVDDYHNRKSQLSPQVQALIAADTITEAERQALMMLYAYMPMSDAVDRTPHFYLTQCVRPAIETRSRVAWGDRIPDELFYHYVLPLRVNNEAIDSHRSQFFTELWPRISKCATMADAILEVNHWCHEKASYQPSDARTHSPQQTVVSAIGRCGEESTIAVAALRAAGIPARQVYTPRWAHTDDNHAWVEAWADGRWHFLGACEPEAVLDLAWFNEPASRGMLMHARTFGHYRGSGEILAVQNGNTDINVTANYAPTDTVTVSVTDREGRPLPGAEVTFRIYNYAEFYPIASKTTDSRGQATLICGRGDLMAWARVPGNGTYGFTIIKASETPRKAVISLSGNSDGMSQFTFTPPPSQGAYAPTVTDSQRHINDLRLRCEDSIRHAYIASWPDTAAIRLLAKDIGVDYNTLRPIINKSRGHYQVITDFLKSCTAKSLPTAVSLLNALPEKDLTDIPAAVLSDARNHQPKRYRGLSDAEYAAYQLSPRVGNEELTPWRQFFNHALSTSDRKAYLRHPSQWVDWVRANITDTLTWYPEQATMSPEAVFNLRVTSPASRDIFFVAGARSIGIPARLCPLTGVPQYLDVNQWVNADFTPAEAGSVQKPVGYLRLTYTPEGNGAIARPLYYTHFTISHIVDGEPQLLSYPDFCSVGEQFAQPQSLAAGRYMLTSGRRMADGSVVAILDFFDIEPNRATDVALHVGVDSTQLQVIGSLDAELKYLPSTGSEPTSLLSTAGRGYYVLGLIDYDTEPSHHALHDLSAASAELDSLGRSIILLYPENHKKLPTAQSDLPGCVTIGTDIGGSIEQALHSGLYVKHPGESRPVFAIADSFGRIVYLTRGYTIGLGTLLATLLRRL